MDAKNPLTYLITFLFLIILSINLEVKTEQHFVLLAKSMLNHQLNLELVNNNASNHSFFQNKYFWPLGPFPAVLIIPFVAFIKPFYQGYISFPITLLNFFLLYKIARILNLNHQKSLLLTTFFIFGSVYTPLAVLPASWYFAQVVACSFLIFAIYEFLNKRRYLVIGVLIAFCTATRLNLIFSSLFFGYYIAKNPDIIKNLLKFTTPIIISLVLIGIYNYSRFQNPFEQGYNLQIIPEATAARREVGLFSLKHIPSNLFYMLLKGPEPVLNSANELKAPYITFDSYGLSLFFLSPVLFLLYKANFKKEIAKVSLVTASVMLIPLLTYYGIGHKQVGFRYALDLFPFIFLILIDPLKKTRTKILYPLIIFGVFFSFFFSILYFGGLDIN